MQANDYVLGSWAQHMQADSERKWQQKIIFQTIEIDKGITIHHKHTKRYWDYKAIFKSDELVGLYLTFVML